MRPLLIVAILLSLSTALLADYRDSFRKAVQARNRGRWAEVTKYLREAISEQPQETGERVNISGMDFVAYLPQFYLGTALFNVGDCVGALEAFQRSEAQGTIKRFPEFNALQGLRRKCEARVAASGPPPVAKPATPPGGPPTPTIAEKNPGPDPAAVNAAAETATAAITRADEVGRAVDQLSTDALLSKVWRTDSALGADEDRAQATLGRARTELDAGRRESNLQRLQEAASLAASAQQTLEGVRQNAQTRREQMAKASAALTPVRPPEPVTPPAPPVAPPPRVEPPAAAPTAKPFSPPAALTAAARLLFSARYQEAASSLGRLRYEPGPAAAQAALLRGAAQYSLYLVGGEREAAVLEQARQAVLECRKLAPALVPDPRAFSPRFVEFFSRTTR